MQDGSIILTASSATNAAGVRTGAVMRIEATTPLTGLFNPAMALTGTAEGDAIGQGGITDLGSGRYAVKSPQWNAGRGAVTWCQPGIFVSGTISSGNSLVGISPGGELAKGDAIGQGGITDLGSGCYAVISPQWNAGRGAVTWCQAGNFVSGTISSGNSLVGIAPGDELAKGDAIGQGGIANLGSGRYAVISPQWNAGRGAVTWCQTGNFTSGTVSSGNSLVGTSPGDQVGNFSLINASLGYAVMVSSRWAHGTAAAAGAVTWVSLATPLTGEVNAGNSLVGTQLNDRVGLDGITYLEDGNFVVTSSEWNGPHGVGEGAVTWVDGRTGRTGPVTAENSLTGGIAGAGAGHEGTLVLGGSRYVIRSPFWRRKGETGAAVGAVTWMEGPTDRQGVIHDGNSLTGQSPGDLVGIHGVVPFKTGHYVVISRDWQGKRGAFTWCDGFQPTVGKVTSQNSLTGSAPLDQIGDMKIARLRNDNFVMVSSVWDSPGLVDAGAITLTAATPGLRGPLTASSSLIGTPLLKGMGLKSTLPFGGTFTSSLTLTSNMDSSFAAMSGHTSPGFPGSVIFSDGRSPLTGMPQVSNMLFLEAPLSTSTATIAYHEPTRLWAVGVPAMNLVRFFSFTPPTEPQLSLRLDSTAEVSPGAVLDFGQVHPGQFSERTYTLVNPGGALLVPGTPVLSAGPFSWVAPASLTGIAPGSSLAIKLRFNAQTPGPALATLTFPTNDPQLPAFTVTLRGTGLPLPGQPFGTDPAPPKIESRTNGGTGLEFLGIPGRRYVLERSTDLLNWPWLRSLTAGPDGLIRYTDPERPESKAYYRLRAD